MLKNKLIINYKNNKRRKPKPFVSCQCLTYGRPNLLNEAVQSFLMQDYDGPKELVILNDHPNIVIKENINYSNIRIVNSSFRYKTIGDKRNACVDLSRGDVILVWDDDDINLPWRISFSIDNLRNDYFKPDMMWCLNNNIISLKINPAHGMGAFSKDLFYAVGGYPSFNSGQDQKIENLFKEKFNCRTSSISDNDAYYIYRFAGTGSYHLSSYGFNKGFIEVEKYVDNNVIAGEYEIKPLWKIDYIGMISNYINNV